MNFIPLLIPMKSKLLLCILSVLGLATSFAAAQQYIEGEVLIKYKEKES